MGVRVVFLFFFFFFNEPTRPVKVNVLFKYVLLSSLEPKKKPSRFFVEQWKLSRGPADCPGSEPSSHDSPQKVRELRCDSPTENNGWHNVLGPQHNSLCLDEGETTASSSYFPFLTESSGFFSCRTVLGLCCLTVIYPYMCLVFRRGQSNLPLSLRASRSDLRWKFHYILHFWRACHAHGFFCFNTTM